MKKTAIREPLIVAVTGHRKFSSIMTHDEWRTNFIDKVSRFIETIQYSGTEKDRIIFLSGCALGVDLWFAEYAYLSGIQYRLYLPFKRTVQVTKGKFNPLQIELLNRLIKHADKTVIVNNKFYPYGYQVRNKALVDNSHLLLTYYERNRSGSANCERYAREKGKWIIDLRQFSGLNNLPHCLDELL
jgi:uncharacterized phage-like protein YoqJ